MARDKRVNPIEIAKISTPSENSASGFTLIYPKSDGKLYLKDGAGSEVEVGGFSYSIATKTTTYAPSRTSGVEHILCDCTSGAFNINLPAVSGNNAMFIITKIDSSANAATVDGNSTETISGGLTAALTKQWESITITGNGSQWIIS